MLILFIQGGQVKSAFCKENISSFHRNYGTGVDVWAVGCILAELLLRIPFIAGDTDLDQLAKIFQALGTPTVENWPGHTELPDFVQFKSYPTTPLDDIFTAAGPDLIGNNRVTLEIKD